jgi:hypothetical protein
MTWDGRLPDLSGRRRRQGTPVPRDTAGTELVYVAEFAGAIGLFYAARGDPVPDRNGYSSLVEAMNAADADSRLSLDAHFNPEGLPRF